MAFESKPAILSAIAKTDDPAMKTVLLLLLGVFEEVVEKMDKVLSDEQTLRQMVLNGHEPVHHRDHEWIGKRIAREDEVEAVMSWAKQKMEEEKENRSSTRKIRDGVIQRMIELSLAGAIGVVLGRIF